jgi:hypothetical protein
MTIPTPIVRKRIQDPRPTTPAELAKIKKYVETSVPDKHKIATERALLKQVSRSVAMRVKCLSCSNYEMQEAKNCAVVLCPLWPYRPYQGASATLETEDTEEQE